MELTEIIVIIFKYFLFLIFITCIMCGVVDIGKTRNIRPKDDYYSISHRKDN